MHFFKPPNTLQLRVSILEIKPAIWRRLIVPTTFHLGHLHHIIQAAFGWRDTHLHEFQIGGLRFGNLAIDETIDPDGPRLFDETVVRLSNLDWQSARSLTYLYDFGDKWHHQITCENSLTLDPIPEVATCVDGARASPPEDVGGPSGYANFLMIMADPGHQYHRAMKRWCGGRFDPNRFSQSSASEDVCKVLKGKRRSRRRQAPRPGKVS